MSKEQYNQLVARGVLNPCAWCDKENGVKRTADVSHGICPEHKTEFLGQRKANNDQRTQ